MQCTLKTNSCECEKKRPPVIQNQNEPRTAHAFDLPGGRRRRAGRAAADGRPPLTGGQSPHRRHAPRGQYQSQTTQGTRLHIKTLGFIISILLFIVKTLRFIKKMSERTGFLIETVKNYPMLYDPTHEEFRNAKLKNSIWNDIALLVGDNNGDATKARWRNLRDCYSKHLRSRTSTGAASKHTARYKTWPWVQQISFLEPFVGMEPPHHNYDSEKNNMDGQGRINSEHSPQRIKSLKRNRDRDTDWQVDKVINFLNSTSATDYDAIDLIFLGYARTIKKFSPHRQAVAKYNIAKVIMEAELHHIQEMSHTTVEFLNGENRCDSPVQYIEPPEVKMETFGEPLENNVPSYNT